MKSFLKKLYFVHLNSLSTKKNLFVLPKCSFVATTLPTGTTISKSKGSGKSNVKNSSVKKGKKSSKKQALEAIIDEEATEVPFGISDSSPKASKGKKGKKSKKSSENFVEEENLKTNVRSSKKGKLKGKGKGKKVGTKEKEALIDISQYSSDKLNVENIKLGNQNSDLPINYIMNCNKTFENPYENYIQTMSTIMTKSYILNERLSLCYNYASLPVVLEKGNGIFVQDIDNKTNNKKSHLKRN